MNEKLYVTIGGKTHTVTMEDNVGTRALVAALQTDNITYTADDYGNFEKVGDLPLSLPRNDTSITTEPGDIILYQGNKITIYYNNL